jgi:hypothetical protein
MYSAESSACHNKPSLKTSSIAKKYSKSNNKPYSLPNTRQNIISNNRFLQRSIFPVYYNLDVRLKYCSYIINKLKSIKRNTCLVPEKIYDTNGKLLSDGYGINDNIYFHKQIGSDSKSGIVFKAYIKNVLGGEPVAAKLMKMTTNNKTELDICKIVTSELLETKLSRHFLFAYKAFYCKQATRATGTHTKRNMTIGQISQSNYFVLFSELAHGDLKTLFRDKSILSDNNMLCNMLCQCFLAIATFHKLGFLHNDCHNKNILYFKIENTEGFFHYTINGKDYYLKNYGYNVILYDFGLAKAYEKEELDMHPNYYLSDYMRICSAFMNKKYEGWSEYSNLPNNHMSKFVRDFTKFLLSKQVFYQNEDEIIDDIIVSCRYFLLSKDKLPENAIILNKKSFVIDESIRIIK